MQADDLNISAIPAFSDNYIWLIRNDGTTCAVVDPGEAEPVLKVLQEQGLDLRYILLTHHHPDHIGGVPELLKNFQAEVFAPEDDRIHFRHQACREGDRIQLAGLNVEFGILEIPAHTRTHIAFYNENTLFSGDTLFSVGCGRLFEGTPTDMQKAMDKLAALPAKTKNYCGHEYTQSNCAFALSVEPDNTALLARTKEVNSLRSEGKITLPSTLGEELATNPFLRTRTGSVVNTARKIDSSATEGASTMAIIRALKDRF